MVSQRVLPHRVTISQPGAPTVDEYNDPVPGAPSQTLNVPAFLQRSSEDERRTGEGTRLVEVWRMMTNFDLSADDTVIWDGQTFTVEGKPTPAPRLRGGPSHYEATLRRVEEA